MTIDKYNWVNAGRGYAILLVIMIHVSQWFDISNFFHTITSLGDLGVPLFFIMSSFTLYNSYHKRKSEDKYVNRDFFIRRFFRIAPYYYLAGIMYILFEVFVRKNSINFSYIVSNFTFTNGLYLPAINYIPPGGWSVGIEMLFYLTLPILIKYINSLNKAILFLFVFIIISMLIDSIMYYYISHYTNDDLYSWKSWELYFWPPNQYPVFLYGIVLYYIYKNISISKKMGTFLLYLSLILFFSFSVFDFEQHYPYFLINRLYIFGLIFLFFSIGLFSSRDSLLNNRIIEKIGVVSFSMYLNHFMIIYIYTYFVSKEIFNNDVLFIFSYIFIVFITYHISKVTYKYFELNGIKIGNFIINVLEKKFK